LHSGVSTGFAVCVPTPPPLGYPICQSTYWYQGSIKKHTLERKRRKKREEERTRTESSREREKKKKKKKSESISTLFESQPLWRSAFLQAHEFHPEICKAWPRSIKACLPLEQSQQ
jgi:hypothetical protein